MSANDKYEDLQCFYDTKEMRETFPKSYPDPMWRDGLIVPGRIICNREIGLFGTTFIRVLKELNYNERNAEIRRQMEENLVYVAPAK